MVPIKTFAISNTLPNILAWHWDCLAMFLAPQDQTDSISVNEEIKPKLSPVHRLLCSLAARRKLCFTLLRYELWTVVTALVTTWFWWCASGPQWPCQRCSSWCPVATHSPHQTEALKHPTGNAAGLLSCNVPSGPRSFAEWGHRHHIERQKRHQERSEGGYLGVDRRKWELCSHGAGSVCTEASGRSTPQEH